VSWLPVKPEHGPTLPALLAPRWRRLPRAARLAAVALAALLLVAAVLARAVGGAGASGETAVSVAEPVAFNLRHGAALDRVAPAPGERLRLEGVRDGLFLQSFVVRPLELPVAGGPTAAAAYAVLAERMKDDLAARFDEFALVSEGKSRVNEVPGYDVVFTARSGEGRRLYGRWVMLVPHPEDAPAERRGVLLELLGTPAAGIPNAAGTGQVGQLKLPLRSFRFGAEAP
jgi:hypothetical protein